MRFNDFDDINDLNDPFPWPNRKPDSSLPLPPINCFILSPYVNGVLDVKWDNPAILPENTQFTILGVNIYRSFDSEGGPYQKVNIEPLGAGIYRDQTGNTLIQDEVVTSLDRGQNPQLEWRFKTKFKPIVKNVNDGGTSYTGSVAEGVLATAKDIVVKVDNGDGKGLIEVPIYDLKPLTGEVTLIHQSILSPGTDKLITPRLPLPNIGSLTVSYYVNTNRIRSNLHNRIFYKLTTVALDANGQMVESDLSTTKAINLYQQEKTDYMWKEAIRRNRWILEQGGERVKVFIRKWNGKLCESFSDVHQNSPTDCPICFGTNFIGGYEGPFDIIISPPDTEKNIELTEIGLRVNYTWESWTGPSPMLNKRDVVVRPTGERMSVGAVTYTGQRGAIFQQNFTLSQLDSGDIVYAVTIPGAQQKPAESWDTRSPRPTPASPEIPANKPTTRNYPLEKGRTVTFEDIVY